MNDRWSTAKGERWNQEAQIRIARLFRHHVRTPSNPTGRIHREPCFFCVRRSLAGDGPALEHLPAGEFHHVDYEHAFLGVWVCTSHHRQVDHGALKVPKRAVSDYSSLIHQRPHLRREHRPRPARAATGTGDPAPF